MGDLSLFVILILTTSDAEGEGEGSIFRTYTRANTYSNSIFLLIHCTMDFSISFCSMSEGASSQVVP